MQYPEQRAAGADALPGQHQLMRYENGLERCIGCSLCAVFCPAQAIYVEAAENTDEQRVSPGERYAKRYEINMLRCIYCGYCEEACPTEAIVLGHDVRAVRLRPRLASSTRRRCCSCRTRGRPSDRSRASRSGRLAMGADELRSALVFFTLVAAGGRRRGR